MHDFSDFHLQDLVKIDQAAPLFELPFYDPKTDTDGTVSLEDQQGKWTVLFFYPADFTFVCPTELKDMADEEATFKEMGVDVFAVSTDSVFSHKAWTKEEMLMQNFPYKMLADKMTNVSELYNILDEKEGMSGRGTFIIDPDLVVRGIEVTSGPLGRNSEELIRKIQALQFMRNNPTQACPAKWAVGAKTLTPSLELSGKVGEELAK
ncbi:redoxin domain-containing protein [Candidatus Gracilibacteria bacterium]|nr:redoxin domain-containing protein [Candidatus Gracilibacteria bacterium]